MRGPESFSTPNIPESHEENENSESVEKTISNIQDVMSYIEEQTGASGEELVELTDEALVHVANETIGNADEDGVRTEEEAADISAAVESVIVQGAMEEAGMVGSSGENPILGLNETASSDVVASISDLHAREATLPNGDEVAELAVSAIERDKWSHMRKVSERLGSNDGGWYEDDETGERYYVKFYENPSQGKVEFIANAIYTKLGIKTVHSELIQMDGREAVASPAVPNAHEASREDQKASQDVRSGFVADAYLANWDVIGLVYDNVVESDDGFYRIDNGGSLIFRAQGGDKAYSPDDIPEFQSMLKPGRPAGEVFAGITEDEIAEQARALLEKLSPEDIEEIVEQSGLEGEERDRVLKGLLGRREFLARRYGPKEEPERVERPRRPYRGVGEIVQDFGDGELERSGETVVRPRSEIICDHGHIEGQRIDIICKTDQDEVEFSFKLRDSSTLADSLESSRVTQSGAAVNEGEITFQSASNPDDSYSACRALCFERDGLRVQIAAPVKTERARALRGLVRIDAPKDMPPEEVEATLARILEEDFQIPDALSEVPPEDEQKYKRARFAWQHKIGTELSPEQAESAEGLQQEEVFPGYTTYVEPGKHKEYLRHGEGLRAVHELHSGDARSIARVLQTGLMCSSERYTRGVMRNGMSTEEDFQTGGADSVFTRIQTPEQQRHGVYRAKVILKPEVFDRTDWYTYEGDHFGSTEDSEFASRAEPDEIFRKVAEGTHFVGTNEQMFRTGIGPRYVESIVVYSYDRDKIIADLKARGITEFDGKPIEDIIIADDSVIDPNFSFDSGPSFDSAPVMTPEEYEQQQKEKEKQKQEKKQAILDGTGTYDSVEELIDISGSAAEDLVSMLDVIVAHGGKDKLIADLSDYMLDFSDVLQKVVDGDMSGFDEDETAFILYMKDTLGMDFSELHAKAIDKLLAPVPPDTPSPEPDSWAGTSLLLFDDEPSPEPPEEPLLLDWDDPWDDFPAVPDTQPEPDIDLPPEEPPETPPEPDDDPTASKTPLDDDWL